LTSFSAEDLFLSNTLLGAGMIPKFTELDTVASCFELQEYNITVRNDTVRK
jgi:hypothetical protein